MHRVSVADLRSPT